MKIKHLHLWPQTIAQVRKIQEQFCDRIIAVARLEKVTLVAGVDSGFEQRGYITRAAVALLSFPKLELIEHHVDHSPTKFPYVPGYLSFREVPAAIKVLRKLSIPPDLILCDGQGLAHPKRFGLASHLGLIADIPTMESRNPVYLALTKKLARSREVGRLCSTRMK